MDLSNSNNHIFDWKLAKIVGLRQMLNPNSMKIRGYNVYQLFIAFGLILPKFVVTLMIPIGLYHWMEDKLAVTLCCAYISNYLFTCGKSVYIMYNSNKLWELYEVSNSNFMSYRCYNVDIFRNWRLRCKRLSSVLIMISVIVLFFWAACPHVLKYSVVRIKNVDGSWNVYRLNIYNLYFMVSDATYNEHFNIFYCVELVVKLTAVFTFTLFHFIIVTMSCSINCQLEMISYAVQSLGHNNSYSRDINKSMYL